MLSANQKFLAEIDELGGKRRENENVVTREGKRRWKKGSTCPDTLAILLFELRRKTSIAYK
jgi:hypothetical protein